MFVIITAHPLADASRLVLPNGSSHREQATAMLDFLNIFKTSNFRDFKKTKVSQQDKDALQVLELNEEVKWEQIQSKFKELVKKYHPDKNQGSKKFEDKLKKITLAYSQLKKTLGKK